jgi:DNA-binding NtrC family response regulator
MPGLIGVLHRAVEVSRLMREPVTLPNAPVESRTALVGTDRAMQEVCKEIGRVAAKPVTVLIRGETGTGKELIARAIYQHSLRAQAPFIAINCAAIPENLLESELFGHERGAFTGADQRRIGRFEQANKGTLFLDEIGDVPPAIQVKLLRVLQDREFERLGGTRTLKVDVRLIAATNRDLRAALEEGTFREDLYYRLNVVAIDIPPLREHKEDIPALAEFFLEKVARESGKPVRGFTPQAVQRLADFHWPGNVRELENAVERAVTLSTGSVLDAADIHLDTQPPGGAADAAPVLPRGVTLEQWEEEVIREALRRASGNKSQAARSLGLTRNALRYRLSKMGVSDPPEKES